MVSLCEPASISDLVASRDPSILIFIIAYTAGLKGNLRSCDNVMSTNINLTQKIAFKNTNNVMFNTFQLHFYIEAI